MKINWLWFTIRFILMTIPIVNIFGTIRATKDMGEDVLRLLLIVLAAIFTPLAWIFGWKWIIAGDGSSDGSGF